MYRKSMRSALEEARAYSAVNEVKVSKGGKTLNISKKDVEVYQAKGWSLQEANMKRILQALQDKLSDEGGAAGFDDLKKTAKSMGLNLTPAMLKDMPGIKQHRDGDYILEEIELDEALEVKWDSNKQGWFDKQGRRRYLGKMATNKLMSKAIDKAKETGDFINPFKLQHGQKPEEVNTDTYADSKKKMLNKEETITEFKKMVVTIKDPIKRAEAMDDIKRFGKGTGFRIDKMSDGKSFRIDGKGADLNKFATDMKNFYGAEIKAESLEEKFTKKDFDINEDENDHSLNAIMLAKEFGKSKEIKDMEDIDKRHKQRGHINEPDYSKRNALVKKYYSRLK